MRRYLNTIRILNPMSRTMQKIHGNTLAEAEAGVLSFYGRTSQQLEAAGFIVLR